MDSSSRAVHALVLAGVWLVVVVAVRFGLNLTFARYERRLAERDPSVAARRRTTFSFLLRIVLALVVLIGAWGVLSVFPTTQEVARAFLASGAVLALVAGIALSTPLGNLGSGVLLAFTQPVRLGDRITVGEHTGVVERISLSYTALVTDEGPHVFVPNQMMVSTALVNLTRGAPGAGNRGLTEVRPQTPQRQTQSLRPCASGSPSSFFSVLFSIWRMRSRVTPNARPTSSRVHGWEPSSP
jgi:small-conductance mechanosensitive channel